MTHVFISYSRHNYDEFVERFRADLQHAGIPVWLDKQQLKPGTLDWEKALRVAIKDARYVLFCASKFSAESQYCRDELSIARMEKTPIIPIWVQGENDRFHDCIPLGYSMIQTLDARGKKYNAALQELLDFLRQEIPAFTNDVVGTRHAVSLPEENTKPDSPIDPTQPPRNPYKGLRAFQEDDSGDFFGRESVIAALLEKLRVPDTHFLAITGASGSGKSSVIMAGLLPQLRQNALPESEKWLIIGTDKKPDTQKTSFHPVIPGAHPLENLALRLKKHLPGSTTTGISDELAHKSTRGLYLLAREIAEAQNVPRLVLFIDQFEEVFTQTVSDDERRQFLDVLVTAANEPDSPLLILLTLRADFLHAALNHGDFVTLLNQHHYFVKPMALYELENAIQNPADLDQVKLTFEPGLVAEMVFTLRENPDAALAGALPLLQFALEQLYENRQDRILTREAYNAMGGVQGAIGTHAEAVYGKLDEDAQNALPLVFAALVNVDERGTATRRRAPLDDLRQTDAARKLVDTLIKNRLLVAFTEIPTSNPGQPSQGAAPLQGNIPTPNPSPLHGEGNMAFVEVAHEALLRTWTRLVGWIDTAKDDLQLRDAVTTAAERWANAGKPEFLLWKHEQLAPVYAMQERRNFAFGATVQEFIKPEADRLLEKFIADKTHHRRMTIIERWGEIGEAAVMQMVEAVKYANDSIYDGEQTNLLYENIKNFPIRALQPITYFVQSMDWRIRRNAVKALGIIGDASVVPILLLALKDFHSSSRWYAVQALGKLGDSSVVPALIDALQDLNNWVRRYAAEALGKLGDSSAVPALIAALQDKDSDVRSYAAEALGELGNSSAIPALIDASHDIDDNVRRNAIHALGQLGDATAFSALIIASHDKNKWVRKIALDALHKLKNAFDIPVLINSLQHKDWRVSQEAIQILKKLGKVATPELITILQDKNSSLRLNAAVALGILNDISAVPVLIAAMYDYPIDLRKMAARSLGKLISNSTTNSFTPLHNLSIIALSNALNDRDRNMRIFVVEALLAVNSPETISTVQKSKYVVVDIVELLKEQTIDTHSKQELALLLEKINTPEALAALAEWRAKQGETGGDNT